MNATPPEMSHATPNAIPTLDQLVARAKGLVPYLRTEAQATDERRSLSPETMRRLFDTGLLRFFQPRRYGGYEMDFGSHYPIAKALARGCPSVAWIAGVVGHHALIVGRFPREAQDEVWADQDQLVCMASVQKKGNGARAVDGGYHVDGVYGFASGIDHANWGMAFSTVEGQGLDRHFLLMPRRDYEIADVWHVLGMRGTGTKDMVPRQAFVPAYRAMKYSEYSKANPPGARWSSSYLYSMETGPQFNGVSVLGPIVGTAEAALADYLELSRNRKSAITGADVTNNEAVHMQVSESAADIHAADLIARTDLAMLHDYAKSGRAFTEEEKLAIQRNRAYVADRCMKAVQRLIRMMGAMGLFDDNPLNRYFRDIHAMTTQASVAFPVNMPNWGRWALGHTTKTYIG